MKDMLYSMVFATVATALSYFIGLHFGWITGDTLIDVVAVWTSYSCTWMCVTQNHLAFPLGIVSTILYGISFWDAHLLSSAISSFWLFPVQVVGWWYWFTGGKKVRREVPVTRLTGIWNAKTGFYVGLTLITWGGLWWVTQNLGAVMAPFDSAILLASLFAQYLMQGKKIENWVVWICMNVVCIYVYFTTDLFLFGVQYIFFIATDITGLFQWWKSYRSTRASDDATVQALIDATITEALAS